MIGRLIFLYILIFAIGSVFLSKGIDISYIISLPWFGTLPGDFVYESTSFKIAMPFLSSLLVAFPLYLLGLIFSSRS